MTIRQRPERAAAFDTPQLAAAEFYFKLFMCNEEKKNLKGTAALEYIKWGESQEFHTRPSCSNRARWWDLGTRRFAPLISPSSVSDLARTFKNSGVYADKRLYEIYPKLPKTESSILISTNAITSSLFLELGSRTGLGEGLLDLTVYELAACPVVLTHDLNRNKEVISEIAKRDFLPYDKELQHPSRLLLDEIVFDFLDLTKGEREAVYEAVVQLVEARLKKASSLKPKDRVSKRLEAVERTQGVWQGVPDFEDGKA